MSWSISEKTEFLISPSHKGYAFPQDFLNSKGTFGFRIARTETQRDSLVFHLKDDEFLFSLGFKNSRIVFQRNDDILTLGMKDLPASMDYCRIHAMWTPTELILNCSWAQDMFECRLQTQPSSPPIALIKWARQHNLLPRTEYDTVEEFRSRVYSCLDSIQSKIDESGSIQAFWDFEYEGKKVVSRKPKRETDIHPLIHSLLSDQMLMSSIDVIPEYKTGIGNLDFMFVGHLKDQGSCKLCGEFKNAHSRDIFNGLETQLPAYMENQKVKYGAYCVLCYEGEWYREPAFTPKELEDELMFKLLSSTYKNRIRIFCFDLTKTKTASGHSG